VTADDTHPPRVDFLVVGSARSGTTLVQRLACEIPGVRMPAETHFFSGYARDLFERVTFPLSGGALEREIGRFLDRENAFGLELDVKATVADLGGSCAGPFALFDALVRGLAGPAQVWGEKTPDHLLWWRPVSRAAPWLRFVLVVRDPRAVVASSMSVPWRDNPELSEWGTRVHLAMAQRWAIDQHQAAAMSAQLGPDRCLVVRYEDVVVNPGAARSAVAEFLGLPTGDTLQVPPSDIVHEWEPWKRRALEDVGDDRVAAWRTELTRRQAGDVAVVCRDGMGHFGYHPRPGPARSSWATIRMGRRTRRELARFRDAYRWYQWEIDRRSL
jgi:hypothetical protein